MIQYEYINPEIKTNFLSTCSNDNQKTYYGRLLSKANKLEEEYNKDLCNFNQNELDNFLKSLNATSEALVGANISIIKKYIEFAIKSGYVDTGINYAALIPYSDSKNYTQMFINREKYLDETQLNDIVDSCFNPQDACLFQLLYEGIMGDELSEIRNLKISDVDFENKTLSLTNVKSSGVIEERKLTVSYRLLELIKEAYAQVEYFKNNGEEHQGKGKHISLAHPTPYIIKSKVGNEGQPIIKETLIRRFILIKEALGYCHIIPKSVFKSGILKKLRNIKEKNGEVTIIDYKRINYEHGYKNEQQWLALKVELEKYI